MAYLKSITIDIAFKYDFTIFFYWKYNFQFQSNLLLNFSNFGFLQKHTVSIIYTFLNIWELFYASIFSPFIWECFFIESNILVSVF